MEVIDTSITNVALPHIQGNLGATTSEAAWVVTAYAIANVITMPLAVMLGDLFGKKAYFIFSVIGFTLASILCGMADSLNMLIFARVMQGLFWRRLVG
jgi:Major Facilitator Superfamily.